MRNLQTNTRGYIYLGLATLAFSTMELVGKVVSPYLHPFQITWWRFAIGAAVLFPFALAEIRRRKLSLGWGDFAYFLGLGGLCIVVCMSFFQTAILYARASAVAAVFCANPVFTVPFAYFLLREKVSPYAVAALLLGLAGVAVIMNPFAGAGAAVTTSREAEGILLAFVSALIWALYTVLGKKRVARYGGIVQNCFSFFLGDALLVLFFPALKISLTAGIGSFTWLPLLYLGIFVTGLGFFFYFQGMGYTSATSGSIVFFLKPGLAALLASFFLNEPITFQLVLGIILILLGSACMVLWSPEKRGNRLKPN